MVVLEHLCSYTDITRPHWRGCQPNSVDECGQVEAECLSYLLPCHGEAFWSLVQQADVFVGVRGVFCRRRRTDVGDGTGGGGCQDVDWVAGAGNRDSLPGEFEARDEGVEVGAAGAGGGVLEVGGAVGGSVGGWEGQGCWPYTSRSGRGQYCHVQGKWTHTNEKPGICAIQRDIAGANGGLSCSLCFGESCSGFDGRFCAVYDFQFGFHSWSKANRGLGRHQTRKQGGCEGGCGGEKHGQFPSLCQW